MVDLLPGEQRRSGILYQCLRACRIFLVGVGWSSFRVVIENGGGRVYIVLEIVLAMPPQAPKLPRAPCGG